MLVPGCMKLSQFGPGVFSMATYSQDMYISMGHALSAMLRLFCKMSDCLHRWHRMYFMQSTNLLHSERWE